jgi:tRNA (guanine-N7-)-methyltransferase
MALALPTEPARLDAPTVRPGARDLWLEIGFGGGEHLAAQAAAHPDVAMIGAEPFAAGVASLAAKAARDGLDNIRIWPDVAKPLLAALADASLGRLFILFPDPWPKTRHHKRRLVDRDTLDTAARLLRVGGLLRLATDDHGYARWMLERLAPHPAFRAAAGAPGDWTRRPPDWPTTRYEAKRLTGAAPLYFEFIRG